MRSIIQSQSPCGGGVCVCVCNPIPQIEATNRGKCPCVTSNMHHFLPPFCLAFVGSSYGASVWLLWSFLFFFFSPVFMHQCVHLSVTQSQSVINWLALQKVFSPHSALITVSVSVIFDVCHSDRWSVCVWHQWSHLAFFLLQRTWGSGLLGPNQWLQSLAVYSFIPERLSTRT